MILKGDLITRDDAPNAFFSSFEGKYTIMDNLDEKGDPVIHARKEVYNAEYIYVTIVLRGTLNIIIGGTKLEVKANEYLAVMPCMSVEVEESRCIFFSYLTRSHLMADIYKRTHIHPKFTYNAFKFHHLHFTQEEMETLLESYVRIKREHQHENYPMKEIVLRAYYSAHIAKLFSMIDEKKFIHYIKDSRQHKFFSDFINTLNLKHKEERSVQYYAEQLHITPKYLTTIVYKYTGLTASQAIDQYIIYAIKQTLYNNEYNIKKISLEYNFPSQSFFGRYFKRITGMSPLAYVKHNNIKSINFASNQ